jgi:Leucine-rich repeat (LRR) protein
MGNKLRDCVTEKYLNKASVGDDYALTVNQSKVKIEMVGMEEIENKVEELRAVSLASSKIAVFDGSIVEECILLEELDLSDNHLTSIGEILQVVCEKTHVASLNLSGNVLFAEEQEAKEGPGENALQRLGIAGTQIRWSSLNLCLNGWESFVCVSESFSDFIKI